MSDAFQAHLEILPEAQRRLWRELRPTVQLGFVLYGGTAIALRLGHRLIAKSDDLIQLFKVFQVVK